MKRLASIETATSEYKGKVCPCKKVQSNDDQDPGLNDDKRQETRDIPDKRGNLCSKTKRFVSLRVPKEKI